jgi:copper chaperone CopZ
MKNILDEAQAVLDKAKDLDKRIKYAEEALESTNGTEYVKVVLDPGAITVFVYGKDFDAAKKMVVDELSCRLNNMKKERAGLVLPVI